MHRKSLSAFLVSVSLAVAQVNLNPNPSRVIGHPQLQNPLVNLNPNLVEGRELLSPQGIAVDTSASPPILYVADTGNNRILVWKNAAGFSSGAPADLIIGQKDHFSTLPQGPGIAGRSSIGLNSPTGLAVNQGNLYVVDSGNNRILRFPVPTSQTNVLPDLVIGQASFDTNGPNQGGTIGPNTILLRASANSAPYSACLAFDKSGNLWFVDAGNRRVVMYPGDSLREGNNGPNAIKVIGQPDLFTFQTPISISSGANFTTVLSQFAIPQGVAVDEGGSVYVTDSDPAGSAGYNPGRMLVFKGPIPDQGAVATYVAGAAGSNPTAETLAKTNMYAPGAVFFLNGGPAVMDTVSSRILVFGPYGTWPLPTAISPSPLARMVIGQVTAGAPDFTIRKANSGSAEASARTLSLPTAAVLAGDEIYVADTGNNRVIVFPAPASETAVVTGSRVLGQTDFRYSAPNLIEGREFNFAGADAGLVVDSSSGVPHLYVADPNNNRVLGFADVRKVHAGDKADIVIGQRDMFHAVCNYNLNNLAASDISKPTAAGLCQPIGVAMDAGGNLWVADAANSRVVRFPAPFGQADLTKQIADRVLGQPSLTAKIPDISASAMKAPYGLAFDGTNGLFVSDRSYNRVLYFAGSNGDFSNGQAATKVFGQPDFTTIAAGAADNRMNSPHHVSVDGDGRLYVADAGNNRILIFPGRSELSGTTGFHAAVSLTGLRQPFGVFVNPETGEFWVADTNTPRAAHYPKFDDLILADFAPDFNIATPTNPLTLTQDQFGDLYVGDVSSRVANYYPSAAALNSASFLTRRALAPGVWTAIFGAFGGDTVVAGTVPFPTTLGDLQVLVDDQPAPVYFVSPGQINFLIPMSAPTSGTVQVQVVRVSTGQVLGVATPDMNTSSPALFTSNASGSGQVAALNVNDDGSFTVNSANAPVGRGKVIALYATGQGPVADPPADGAPAPNDRLINTPAMPQVLIGTGFVPPENVLFSGLAPGLVGVWQINVKVPDNTAVTAQVPVVIQYNSTLSNSDGSTRISTTIAVK